MYRWMHVLKGLLFDDKCMVRSWRTCSTRASITACTGQIFHKICGFANVETRFAWQRLFFTNCYCVLRSISDKCHLQGSLQGKALLRLTNDCFLRFLFSRIVLHFFTLVLSSECLTIPCPLISCTQLWLLSRPSW